MSKPTARIFDRNRPVGPTAMASRTDAAWRWAERNGFVVLDEHVAWGANAGLDRPPKLVDAVQRCAAEGSTLIVYSVDVLSDDSETVQWVRKSTGQRVRAVTEPATGEAQ
jgi:hypothetical protein